MLSLGIWHVNSFVFETERPELTRGARRPRKMSSFLDDFHSWPHAALGKGHRYNLPREGARAGALVEVRAAPRAEALAFLSAEKSHRHGEVHVFLDHWIEVDHTRKVGFRPHLVGGEFHVGARLAPRHCRSPIAVGRTAPPSPRGARAGSTLLVASGTAGASCARAFIRHFNHFLAGDAQEVEFVLKPAGELRQAAHAHGLDRDYK